MDFLKLEIERKRKELQDADLMVNVMCNDLFLIRIFSSLYCYLSKEQPKKVF